MHSITHIFGINVCSIRNQQLRHFQKATLCSKMKRCLKSNNQSNKIKSPLSSSFMLALGASNHAFQKQLTQCYHPQRYLLTKQSHTHYSFIIPFFRFSDHFIILNTHSAIISFTYKLHSQHNRSIFSIHSMSKLNFDSITYVLIIQSKSHLTSSHQQTHSLTSLALTSAFASNNTWTTSVFPYKAA